MEKQIGCMSGILQIFDRQHILAGNRIHFAKRLPTSSVVGGSPETGNSGETREFSRKPEPQKHEVVAPSNANNSQSSQPKMNDRSKSPTKSFKEIHRHSLDSRINISKTPDTERGDSQRRSPSVIARLMGLEPMPSSDNKPPQTVTLRRSTSESRLSRDLSHSNYIDDNNFQLKQPNKPQTENESKIKRIVGDDRWRSRSFFDSSEFYPEPNNRPVAIHKKLKIKGIDEQANDLTTLKQILEVLQLKGLIRSANHSRFAYERNVHCNESNIVLVKPSKADYQRSRSVNDSRYACEYAPARRSPVRVKASSPYRIESNLKACNSIGKAKDSSIGIQRRDDKSSVSIHDSPKRNGCVRHCHSSINRSSRSQKLTESLSVNRLKQKFVTEDESLSVNECIFSTPSTTDSEKSKGKSSLQRCDKLVTVTKSATESPPSSAVVLPSPVSVLDSEFDKDESVTRSHRVDLKEREEFTSDDVDFIYISKIIRATQHLPEDPNVFLSLEKQLYNTTSNVSKRQRKLIFDVVLEIINRNVKLPPWRQVIDDSRALVKHVWFEFQKIREVNTGDGVLELVSGIIEKDLVEIYDWRDYPIEKSELVLDIERMIFKDLVSEMIRDMIQISGEFRFLKTRRKLVF